MSPKKWALTCLLLLLISDTRCQKDDIKSDSQQSIDEAERREGKPQDSGNGKDFVYLFLSTVNVNNNNSKCLKLKKKCGKNSI